MKRFKEYLNELFDNPVDFKIKSERLGDRTEYVFNLSNSEYRCLLNLKSISELTVAFGKADDVEKKYKISNSGGNEIKVFSTVMAIIKDFLEDNPRVNKIEYSADIDEPSRIKLYDSMSKKLASTLGFKLDRVEFYDDAKYYILKREF